MLRVRDSDACLLCGVWIAVTTKHSYESSMHYELSNIVKPATTATPSLPINRVPEEPQLQP